jgi:general secretion pathway protein L
MVLMGLATWWADQMRELAPALFRMSGQPRRPVLVIEARDFPLVRLSLRGKNGAAALGQYGANSAALGETLARLPKAQRDAAVLQLPPGLLLERTIILPLAAERDLLRVVGYEMDRLTPFRLDAVVWSCKTLDRNAARQQLQVQLRIVPRAPLQPMLDALGRAGVVPACLEAVDDANPGRAIPLGGQPGRSRLQRRMDALALAGCGALAVVAAALPFVLQSFAWNAIEARIEAVKADVTEAELLRGRIARSATAAGAVAAERSQAGAPLHALALLTEALPDDTVLTQLSAQQRKLTISGRSAGAARLLGTLAAHPLLRDPAFTAPVIRDDASGAEMFSIRLELGG